MPPYCSPLAPEPPIKAPLRHLLRGHLLRGHLLRGLPEMSLPWLEIGLGIVLLAMLCRW